jgi:hypothetical protein
VQEHYALDAQRQHVSIGRLCCNGAQPCRRGVRRFAVYGALQPARVGRPLSPFSQSTLPSVLTPRPPDSAPSHALCGRKSAPHHHGPFSTRDDAALRGSVSELRPTRVAAPQERATVSSYPLVTRFGTVSDSRSPNRIYGTFRETSPRFAIRNCGKSKKQSGRARLHHRTPASGLVAFSFTGVIVLANSFLPISTPIGECSSRR